MDELLRVLGMASLRVAVVLALGLLAGFLLRRASAAVRHSLLVAAVLGALAVPLLSLTLPEVRLELPAMQTSRQEAPAAPAVVPAPTAPVPVRADADPTAAPTRPTPTPERPARSAGGDAAPVSSPERTPLHIPAAVWLGLWAAGMIALFLRLFIGWLAAGRIIRHADPAGEPVLVIAGEAAAVLGLRRTPRIRLSAYLPVPAISGVFRPTVLLPEAASAWPEPMLRAALLHELAHIRRRDTLTQALVELLCGVYWFNPLAWLTARRMRIEREAACDDAVLNAGVPNRAYADVLLDSVAVLQSRPAPSFAGLAMARNGKLGGRVTAIMDKRRNRRPLTILGILLLLVAAAGAVVLIALPGARTKVAALLPAKPLPENQDLIITKDKWNLHGPVKRVELYDAQDGLVSPSGKERLLSTLEFDEAGRLIYQSYNSTLTGEPQQETRWRFNSGGMLIGMEHNTEKPIIVRGGPYIPSPFTAYEYLINPPERYFSSEDKMSKTAFDGDGRLSGIDTSTAKDRRKSIRVQYDRQGNPIVVDRTDYSAQEDTLTLKYDYDSHGNWTSQRREDRLTDGVRLRPVHSMNYRFQQRITYYPSAGKAVEGLKPIRTTRADFGLQGPVRSFIGPPLLRQTAEIAWALDLVEFDRQGRVQRTIRYDGSQNPENVMERANYYYYRDGGLQRIERDTHNPRGLGSPAAAFANDDFVMGHTIIPKPWEQRGFSASMKSSSKYDSRGRLIEEEYASDKEFAHAVCRYDDDKALLTVTDKAGKVTDRIRLVVTRDRYGNELSRKYTWELQDGKPSDYTRETTRQLIYENRHIAGYAHGSGKRAATVKKIPEGYAVSFAGPVPRELSPGLLSLGERPTVLYGTESATGYFPLPTKAGEITTTELAGAQHELTGFVSSFAGAAGPSPSEGMVIFGWDRSYGAGTTYGAWQLALHPVTMERGKLTAADSWSALPSYRPVNIRFAHKNPQLIWWEKQGCYCLVAEDYNSSRPPGISYATVQPDGTIIAWRRLPFSGYSPSIALTGKGLLLCYVERGRFGESSKILLATSPDGLNWGPVRRILPGLAPVKEVAMARDDKGMLHLLAMVHTPAAAIGMPSRATLYYLQSSDDGATWSKPTPKVGLFQSEYIEDRSISLAVDAQGQPWYAFAELGYREGAVHPDVPHVPSAKRTAARLIVGRLPFTATSNPPFLRR